MATLKTVLLIAATMLLIMPCAAQERAVFVDSTQHPIVVVHSDQPSFLGDRDIGAGDFHVEAHLRLSGLDASGTSFRMGESYFGFDGPNQELFLLGDIVGGRHVRIGAADAFLEAGTWFHFEVIREGPTISFLIDGRLVRVVRSFVAPGRIGFAFAPLGRMVPESSGATLSILNFIVVGRSRSITAWSEGPLPRLIEPLLGRFGRKWS